MDLNSVFPISGRFIAVDGSSVTEAPIPFLFGHTSFADGSAGFNYAGAISGIGPGFSFLTGADETRSIITKSVTQTSSNSAVSQILCEWAGTSSSFREVLGQKILVNTTSGSNNLTRSTGGLIGQDIFIYKNGTADITSIIGQQIQFQNNGGLAGDVSELVLQRLKLGSITGSTGTITAAYGLDIASLGANSLIATKVGLRIAKNSGGSSGNTGILMSSSDNAISFGALGFGGAYIVLDSGDSKMHFGIYFGGVNGWEFDNNLTVDSTLTVTGTTTLATSLSGLANLTSGVVSAITSVQGDLFYASAANTVAKLTKDTNATRYLSNTGGSNNPAWAQVNLADGVTGTLPITSTSLSVAAPITYGGGIVGFDQTDDFTWTGLHNFQFDVHLNDSVLLSFDGGGKALYLTGNTGELEGYADGIINFTMGSDYWRFHSELYADNNLFWNSSGGVILASFGGTLASAIVTPNGTSDGVSITKQSTASAIRAILIQSEWAGSSSASVAIQAQNIFVSTATSATGSLTGTNALRANRAVVRHRATNAAATVANGIAMSTQIIMDTGAAAMTNGTSYFVESPSIGVGATLSNYYGIRYESVSVLGSITNYYGLFIPAVTAASNNYEVWLDTDAAIFFRAAGQNIYSSAANTLDDDAGTTRNFRIGGTTEATLTSTALSLPTNDFAVASGSKIHMKGSSGDTYHYYDSGSSSWKFYVNGALAMELK